MIRRALLLLALSVLAARLPGCTKDGAREVAEAHDEHEAHDGHEAHEAHDAHEGHEHGAESTHAEAEPGHVDGHGDHAEHAHEGEPGHEAEGEHHEDRVTLPADAIAAAGIRVDAAGPRAISVTLDLPGEVVPNADRLAHIVPRFPGIAKEVRKGLGDEVAQNEVLAIVESNESLSAYEVRSLIAGTVIEKHITLGEFVRDDADVFVVADLSTVWVQVSVYARDVGLVKRGQKAALSVVGDGPTGTGTIDYVAPALGEATRAATARVVLRNPGLAWRPGMFVTARVVIDEATANVAVPHGTVQRFEGNDVVFVEHEGAFEPRPVRLGRSDGAWTEVTSGVDSGDRYVSSGAFVLKSELMKSEAGHQH